MKPEHKKSKRLKEVRGIWKRQHQIWEQKKSLGYIKLKKPIRHGWFKEIVITQNVDRYKTKEHILELYDIIEKRYWGRTKDEADKHWFRQISKYLIYKDFPTISKRQFNRLSYKAQKMCTVYSYRTRDKKLRKRFYVRIPKGAYRIKYTRAYVTHSKRIDPVLESEDALLDNKLLQKGYYEANAKFCGWNRKDYWTTQDFQKDKLKVKKQLKALQKYPIAAILNGKITWERN
ncbi:hypothetical protein [uncultured Tenacibaculum sp.]|uniref:hypothetical protein n=1 Tax=uncultured Tenacibaculum sp. TaxID=174713 RepID=UPI00260C0045|nr:hypothetical protein [uncultured Tenacibaculum sp.]